MDTTRAEQIASDDALVAPANRLKIGKSNLRLSSDLKSKEATLQVVYDAILTFLRDLGHSGEIKVIIDVNVNKLHQPWRSFAAVINKCISGKSTRYDNLRLSQAQILWGMYHKKNIDYAYLLWEDFFYQVENKNVKKSNEMYYPRFTKVIVNFFMTKDQSISRLNSVNWHYTRDDYMFTTIKVVSRHEDTQLYDAILPNELTNEDIRNSESYKEYYAIASEAEPPKIKASVKKKQVGSNTSKTPPTAKGKRLKTSAKAAITAKKKQPAKTSKAKGLTVLSEVALTKEEQMKLATKRSLIQTHSSHASGSGANEGTSDIPGVPDVPTYGSDDEQISWKSSEEQDDDEVVVNDDDEQTNSDNDGDDFVHHKFSTHDEENKEEDRFDPRVQTPSHFKSTNDEDSDEEIQDANVEGDKMNEEETNEEAEVDALYRDVNANLEGRDTEMTDASLTIIQTTQVIEETHVIITLVNPEGQQHSYSVSSGFVSNMLNPSPDTAISLIPGIVDAYLANKMHEAIKTVDQVKAQVSKILLKIEKTINEQLEAEFLTHLSNESKTSHAVAINLFELELKKILIDKMESNKSIHRYDEQKNLYKTLVNSYESDKLILDTYRDTVSFKRRRDDEDKQRTLRWIKPGTAGESAQAEEPMHTTKDLDEPAHQEFETEVTDDQPNEETSQLPYWF
ncbi:hypothetical protein Tco_0705363 [Tanacetum coccineum]|uniref:Uncharacterized protein n=1 Tax=Tanacetum coccineum TaxID=301880 RepID=A0ABQ4Y6E7_9ASTR